MIIIPVEKAQQEAFIWRAMYSDETVVCEEDVDKFADVDASRVASLFLLPLQGGAAHRVDIPQGATPVFFRRHPLEINVMQGSGTLHPTTHCIGWKRGDEGVYLFVFDDGSTFLTNELQAV